MKTPSEVIKALNCCSIGKCSGCGYAMDENCTYNLLRDATDILEKLQKENESLKAELTAAQQAINAAKAKLRAAGLLL